MNLPKPSLLLFLLHFFACATALNAQADSRSARSSFKEQLRELHKLAADGDFDARAALRRLWLDGQGTQDDYLNVYELARLAEERDDPDAVFSLASAHYHGKGGFERDFGKARELYSKAAEQGHRSATFNLGLMHLRGEGAEKDFDAAYEQFSKANELGHEQALFEMGIVRCEQRRYEEAVAILEHAPLDGEPWNLFFLANAYRGLPPQPEMRRKALDLYRRASDRGILMAHIHSAAMMVDGDEGVEPDPDRAILYLNRMLEAEEDWAFYVFRSKYLSTGPTDDEPSQPRGKSLGVGRGRAELAKANIVREYRIKSGLKRLIEASDEVGQIDRLVKNINRRAEADLQEYLSRTPAAK